MGFGYSCEIPVLSTDAGILNPYRPCYYKDVKDLDKVFVVTVLYRVSNGEIKELHGTLTLKKLNQCVEK